MSEKEKESYNVEKRKNKSALLNAMKEAHKNRKRLNKTCVCVRVDANNIQQAKELLIRHGEEVDDAAFHLHELEDCNYISKWRLDGKWRVSKSEREEVSISKLVILLQGL